MAGKKKRVYGGENDDQRRKQRREKLLIAGMAIMADEGVAAAKVDQICANASVGIRSYYEEFEGKEDLLKAIYDSLLSQLEAKLSPFVCLERAASTDPNIIVEMVFAYLEFMLSDPRRGKIICVESAVLDQKYYGYRRERMELFVSLISNFLSREGEARDMKIIAILIAGGMNEIVIDCLSNAGKFSIEDLSQKIGSYWAEFLSQ